MIAAGILALEREDPDHEPDFVIEYRQKAVIPKIEQYQSEKKLAEAFNPYSDVPKELESDGWAFMGLIEVTNLHHRELVQGLLEGKSVEETLSDISRDTTLSHSYLDKLKSIYVSTAYQDSIESHPLREKSLKKEIIDAWINEWRRMNRSKRSERSIIPDIAALLPRRTLQRRLARLVEEKRPILEGRSLYRLAGIGEEPPLLSEDYVPISTESETIKRSVREPVQKRDPVGYNRAFLDAYRPNKTFYLSGEIRKRLDEKGRSRRAEKVFARLGMKPGDAFNIFLAQALVVVVPLTSQLRGLRGEVDIGKPRWLPKRSAVNIQGFASVDQHALIRRLGKLNEEQVLSR